MSGGNKALIGALAVALAAVAVLLVSAGGDDTQSAAASSFRVQHPSHPELRLAPGSDEPSDAGSKKGKRAKKPVITDLVTTNAITVDPGSTRISVLSCGQSRGIALDGGVIAPPPPAQVAVTMLSRANPNPPYAHSRRNFYVGVRNLDPVNPAEFHASLVCAKGIDVKQGG